MGYNIGSVWGLGDQVDIFEENADESLRIDGDYLSDTSELMQN